MKLDSTNLGNWTANRVVSDTEQISNYTESTFVHLSGDNNIGNLSLSSNLIVGTGKHFFTAKDYNELSNHSSESGTNAKKIFTALSTYLKPALDRDISGVNSVAFGGFAIGDNSFAAGYFLRGNEKYDDRPFAIGNSSIALGNLAKATDRGSVSLGSGLATGQYSVATCGGNALSDSSFAIGGNAIGERSFAHGQSTYSIGFAAFAQNDQVSAIGNGSHAEGYKTCAIEPYSHAEGVQCIASGSSSHAEGLSCIASGVHSHAEGKNTCASSPYSHTEGINTSAFGACAHAEGEETIANGVSSHSEGKKTKANGAISHAAGYLTEVNSHYTYAWSYGGDYVVNRTNTFNINPKEKSAGFYIGENSLKSMLDNMINKICAAANITDASKIAEIKAQII